MCTCAGGFPDCCVATATKVLARGQASAKNWPSLHLLCPDTSSALAHMSCPPSPNPSLKSLAALLLQHYKSHITSHFRSQPTCHGHACNASRLPQTLRYRESTLRANVTATRTVTASLGLDSALKQVAVNKPTDQLDLVVVDATAQSPVPGLQDPNPSGGCTKCGAAAGSACNLFPCNVGIERIFWHTVFCNESDLGECRDCR